MFACLIPWRGSSTDCSAVNLGTKTGHSHHQVVRVGEGLQVEDRQIPPIRDALTPQLYGESHLLVNVVCLDIPCRGERQLVLARKEMAMNLLLPKLVRIQGKMRVGCAGNCCSFFPEILASS